MSTLSAGDLERMRGDLESLLPDTCTIQSNTPASDGSGGTTRSWANAATGVACRIDRPVRGADSARTGSLAGSEDTTTEWVITLHHDQAFTMAQRLVINGLTLEPLAINTGRSWEIGTRIFCREVTI